LEQVTASEKYSEANDIQAEITKRAEQNKYAKLSTEELKKQLEVALKAEDYAKVEALQKEIDKRTGQKKDKTTPDNSSKQPAKKSVKDLEQDLKKAMDAEDYKKADEIQKEIKKLKKP
jgi:excinuclease UvrABC helicase subunit UvrB